MLLQLLQSRASTQWQEKKACRVLVACLPPCMPLAGFAIVERRWSCYANGLVGGVAGAEIRQSAHSPGGCLSITVAVVHVELSMIRSLGGGKCACGWVLGATPA